MMTRAATSPGAKNRETATGRRAMLESGQSERTRRSSGRRLRVAGGTNLTGTVGSPTSDRSVQKLARHIPPSAQTDGALSTLRARKRSALNVWPGARPRVTGRQRRQHRGSGSPNRRANHALRDQMPARERHRAVSLRHRRHVVDPPAATPVETRESRCETGRRGDVDAVVELPAAPARTDRAPAENEDGPPDHFPSSPHR